MRSGFGVALQRGRRLRDGARAAATRTRRRETQRAAQVPPLAVALGSSSASHAGHMILLARIALTPPSRACVALGGKKNKRRAERPRLHAFASLSLRPSLPSLLLHPPHKALLTAAARGCAHSQRQSSPGRRQRCCQRGLFLVFVWEERAGRRMRRTEEERSERQRKAPARLGNATFGTQSGDPRAACERGGQDGAEPRETRGSLTKPRHDRCDVLEAAHETRSFAAC